MQRRNALMLRARKCARGGGGRAAEGAGSGAANRCLRKFSRAAPKVPAMGGRAQRIARRAEADARVQFQRELVGLPPAAAPAADHARGDCWAAAKRAGALPAGCCHNFARQADAFAFLDSLSGAHNTVPFAVEIPRRHGKKTFVVATIRHLLQRLVETPVPNRHFQEIIREGQPCHLFFDLEFATASNPGRDGASLVDAVVAAACRALHEQFGIACSRRDIVDLDSGTPAKFSRHLIFRLPGNAMFASSVHVGAFVGGLLAGPAAHRPDIPLSEELTVLKADGSRTCFVDSSVYSRNRHFRTYGSCKAGKNAVLRIADDNRFEFDFGRLRACSPRRAGSAVPWDVDDVIYPGVFEASLVCRPSGAADAVRLLHCDLAALSLPQLTRHALQPSQAASAEGGGASPFPALDAAVAAAVLPGHVRKWMLFGDSHALVYEIGGSRFCERIGRPHKSNGTYAVARVDIGIFYLVCCCQSPVTAHRTAALPRPGLPPRRRIPSNRFHEPHIARYAHSMTVRYLSDAVLEACGLGRPMQARLCRIRLQLSCPQDEDQMSGDEIDLDGAAEAEELAEAAAALLADAADFD